MKKAMNRQLFSYLFIIVFSYLLSGLSSSYAESKSSIGCVHPELCQLALKSLNLKASEIKNLVTIVGDPHEFEPNPTEVKNLISIPVLITGPSELNPWARKINYQRAKGQFQKTLILNLENADYNLYQGNNREALSHFWLYPKLYCVLFEKIKVSVKTNELKLMSAAQNNCSAEADKIESELKSTLKNFKLPIILTHDALLPLLKTLGGNSLQVVAIKGSGHHQEANVQTVKEMYDALKNPKALWIQEKNIKVPENVLNKKRPNDLTLLIDTNESHAEEMFSILKELNSKLKASLHE